MIWSISNSYLNRDSDSSTVILGHRGAIEARDEEHLIEMVQQEATVMGYGQLEVDAFGDEERFFFRDSKGRRRFWLNTQLEG